MYFFWNLFSFDELALEMQSVEISVVLKKYIKQIQDAIVSVFSILLKQNGFLDKALYKKSILKHLIIACLEFNPDLIENILVSLKSCESAININYEDLIYDSVYASCVSNPSMK